MSSSNESGSPPESSRPRRESFSSQTFTNLFGRTNSTSGPTAPFPGPITTAVAQDQRRRMSISTIGLSGTSPAGPTPFNFGLRRGSVSTATSESVDENAIEDEEGPGRTPNTPFARRMSFGAQALRNARTGTSPGSGRTPSSNVPSHTKNGPSSGRVGGATSPKVQAQASMQSKQKTASDFPFTRSGEEGVFKWSEQLRSRAESTVSSQQRPSFSTSPSNGKALHAPAHERAKSINEIPAPPSTIPAPVQPRQVKKPDAFQERILKGDFYMD